MSRIEKAPDLVSAGVHHLNADSLESAGMAPSPSPTAKTK